jgi:hypothetical protein
MTGEQQSLRAPQGCGSLQFSLLFVFFSSMTFEPQIAIL